MANAGTKSAGAVGTVVQITGPVVDIEFAARELPAIYKHPRPYVAAVQPCLPQRKPRDPRGFED